MRHAVLSQRLSLPSDQFRALTKSLVQNLVRHERITTTHARAREAQRLAERLVTLGKDGSIASRRRAFRVLEDRTLVRRLFGEIAPRFNDVAGGYTRVVRLGLRRGDGAQMAQLAFSRVPELKPAPRREAPKAAPRRPPEPAKPAPAKPEAAPAAPRRLFEGLRSFWKRKTKERGTP